MKIRGYRSSDQTSINKLQAEFMEEFFPEFANDPEQYEWNVDIYDIDENYIKRGGKVWVVEDGDCVTGFGGVCLIDSNTAKIKRVRIGSLHRGNGLGKAIITRIENFCRDNQIKKILVDTDDRFEAAKSMYTDMGYEMYRSETEIQNGVEYTDNYYMKYL